MRSRIISTLALAVACVLSSSCGSSSPTAPTPAAINITGQWAGTYVVASCVENAPGFCAALGSGGSIVLTPNQSGTTITGTLGVGSFSIPVTGSVTDTVVVLAGSGPIAGGATLTLNTWRTTITGASMTGPISFSTSLLPNLASVTANATLTKQ